MVQFAAEMFINCLVDVEAAPPVASARQGSVGGSAGMSRAGGAASGDRLAPEPERRRRYGRFIGREEKREGAAEVLTLFQVLFDDTLVCGAADCVSRSSSPFLHI